MNGKRSTLRLGGYHPKYATEEHSVSALIADIRDKCSNLSSLDLSPIQLNRLESPQHREITRKIAEMIALDALPFSFIEGLGFRRLAFTMDAKYAPPSAEYLAQVVVPEMCEAVKTQMMSMVTAAENISITVTLQYFDGANPTNILFTLMGHWINAAFQRNVVLLGTKLFNSIPSTQDIQACITAILQIWGISHNRCHLSVSGSDDSLIEGLESTGLEHIQCFQNRIQSVVCELFSHNLVTRALAEARLTATEITSNTESIPELAQIQADLQQSMLMDDNDGKYWQKTIKLIRGLTEQKVTLDTILKTSPSIFSAYPSESQWDLLNNILAAIQPIDELLEQSQSPNASISMLIPATRVLCKFCQTSSGNNTLKILRQSALAAVKKYCDFQLHRPYALATVLDPRYKIAFFDSSVQDSIRQWLLDEATSTSIYLDVSNDAVEVADSPNDNNVDTSFDVPNNDISSSSLDDIWNELAAKANKPSRSANDVQEGTRVKCQIEIDWYLREPLLPRQEDPLAWWLENVARLPVLALLARKFLAPPSTVCINNVVYGIPENNWPRYNSLPSIQAEALLFLRKNLPAINFNY